MGWRGESSGAVFAVQLEDLSSDPQHSGRAWVRQRVHAYNANTEKMEMQDSQGLLAVSQV